MKGLRPIIWPAFLGVIGCVGSLMIYKYAGFWMDVFYNITHYEGFLNISPRAHSIILPMGISFYAVQGISGVVDKWRNAKKGEILETTNWLEYFSYMTFFPQLVAGPIVRPGELVPQLRNLPRMSNGDEVAKGLVIFTVGLAKKVLLADNIAFIVNAAYDSPAMPGFWDTLFSCYGECMQIYFDFSAYSDMAIGLGLLFGFKLPYNFLSPYRGTSLPEFWRRNHITFSFWFRDYMYIPLGGSRVGFIRRNLNLLIVWAVGGLWHGASWTFMLWGLYQGVFLMLHRSWVYVRKRFNIKPINKYVAILMLFHFQSFGIILFRASSFQRAVDMYKGFFNFGKGIHLIQGMSIVAWSAFFLSMFIMFFFKNIHEREIKPTAAWALATGLLLALSISGALVSSPFIYFQF